MTTLFISDLHLDASRPDITAQFLDFLAHDARRASGLYILGDLFELWVGDDDPDPDKRRIVRALRELTTQGVSCAVMRGNRDFLLGTRFARDTGCRLLEDGAIVEIHGRRALLMHGDTLCTDDHAYQRLRRIVRNPVVQWMLLRLPVALRHRLAGQVRAGSRAHIRRTAPMIMDVNAQAVAGAFRASGVDLLIHGHTHRPAIHSLEADGRPATRIVLGDWYTQGSVLRWDTRGFDLQSMPRDQAGRPE